MTIPNSRREAPGILAPNKTRGLFPVSIRDRRDVLSGAITLDASSINLGIDLRRPHLNLMRALDAIRRLNTNQPLARSTEVPPASEHGMDRASANRRQLSRLLLLGVRNFRDRGGQLLGVRVELIHDCLDGCRVVGRDRVLELLGQALDQRHCGLRHVRVLLYFGLQGGKVCHRFLLFLSDHTELLPDAF
jgi:hypothetical protein